jgi:hypothetical protein
VLLSGSSLHRSADTEGGFGASCAVALPTSSLCKGRASATFRNKVLSRLVDEQRHKKPTFLTSLSLARKATRKPQRCNDNDCSDACVGERRCAPVEETEADLLPAEGFTPSKACTDNGKCVREICWFTCPP